MVPGSACCSRGTAWAAAAATRGNSNHSDAGKTQRSLMSSFRCDRMWQVWLVLRAQRDVKVKVFNSWDTGANSANDACWCARADGGLRCFRLWLQQKCNFTNSFCDRTYTHTHIVRVLLKWNKCCAYNSMHWFVPERGNLFSKNLQEKSKTEMSWQRCGLRSGSGFIWGVSKSNSKPKCGWDEQPFSVFYRHA